MGRKKRDTYEVDSMKIEINCDNEVRSTFAKTLNKLLVRKGIDQIAFAKKLGIGTGTLSNYRTGFRQPPLETIVQMANILEVDCNYLITGVQTKQNTISRTLGLSGESIKVLESLDDGQKRMLDLLIQSGFSTVLFGLKTANTFIQMASFDEGSEDSEDWSTATFPVPVEGGFRLSTKGAVKETLRQVNEVSQRVYDSVIGEQWHIQKMKVTDKKIGVLEKENKELKHDIKVFESEDKRNGSSNNENE